MLITAIITLGSVIAWAVTARALYRHWVRNELGRNEDHNRLANWLIAVLAIGSVPFLPAIAFVAFVTRNPPLSQHELEVKTQALEAENTRLQQAQANRSPHDCRDYDDYPHYDAFDQIVQPRT